MKALRATQRATEEKHANLSDFALPYPYEAPYLPTYAFVFRRGYGRCDTKLFKKSLSTPLCGLQTLHHFNFVTWSGCGYRGEARPACQWATSRARPARRLRDPGNTHQGNTCKGGSCVRVVFTSLVDNLRSWGICGSAQR